MQKCTFAHFSGLPLKVIANGVKQSGGITQKNGLPQVQMLGTFLGFVKFRLLEFHYIFCNSKIFHFIAISLKFSGVQSHSFHFIKSCGFYYIPFDICTYELCSTENSFHCNKFHKYTNPPRKDML